MLRIRLKSGEALNIPYPPGREESLPPRRGRGFANGQGQREADFIDIAVWRALAERVAEYLRRGRLVDIEGRLQVRRYETAAGKRPKAVEVVANRVRFLDRKPSEAGTDVALSADDETLAEEVEADVPF